MGGGKSVMMHKSFYIASFSCTYPDLNVTTGLWKTADMRLDLEVISSTAMQDHNDKEVQK